MISRGGRSFWGSGLVWPRLSVRHSKTSRSETRPWALNIPTAAAGLQFVSFSVLRHLATISPSVADEWRAAGDWKPRDVVATTGTSGVEACHLLSSLFHMCLTSEDNACEVMRNHLNSVESLKQADQ